jgi:hypothetical protein
MALTDIPGAVIDHVTANLRRRVIGWLCVIIFGGMAIYEAIFVIVVALEQEWGTIVAHLIVGAFFLLAAIISLVVMWMKARRPASTFAPHVGALRPPADLQLLTIVEALLLGYSLARRK